MRSDDIASSSRPAGQDGTLLDTERINLTSLMTALSGMGYPDATDLCHAMIGIPGPECDEMLRQHYGADCPVDEIDKAFMIARAEIIGGGMPLKTGTVELLDTLRAANCPMAIVTSSSRRTTEQHLSLAGIRDRFNTILTRDDVARGKPHPDLYLLAAERLGVAPKACIAIEDSGPGVTAAHAAGATTIMVPDILQPNDEVRARCTAVLPDLHAVVTFLRERYDLGALARMV